MPGRATTWFRVGLWLTFAALLAFQVLAPPFVGIANNGDFGKIAGHLSLQAPDEGASNFIYFQPDYVHTARNYWKSPYASSEIVLVWVALHLSGATGEGDHFDIRWLGAVHGVIVLAAFALLLRQRRIGVAVLAMLIFTDISYTAYLNSFYMDAAALCGLLLLAAAAVGIAGTKEPSPAQILLCAFAAILYLTSKTQHALWALLPAVLLAATGLRCKRPLTRRLAWVGAVGVLLAGGLLLATADPTNRAQALFNKLFTQIGAAPDGAAMLQELGVQPEEMRYIGTHSFSPGSPAANRAWVEAFYNRTGFARLAGWYVRHPGRTLKILWATLATDAQTMRPENLSNFRREDGHPPGARSTRFALWSNFRAALLARWPWHMVLWYAVFIGGAIGVLGSPRSRVAWIGLGVAALGLGEFAAAALADCMETARHLFLFHACSDLTFCFAAAYLAARLARPFRAR